MSLAKLQAFASHIITHNKIYGKKKYGSRKEQKVSLKKDQKTACDKVCDAGKKGQQKTQVDLSIL